MNMSSGENSAYHMTFRSLHEKFFNNNKIRGRAPYGIGRLTEFTFMCIQITISIYVLRNTNENFTAYHQKAQLNIYRTKFWCAHLYIPAVLDVQPAYP